MSESGEKVDAIVLAGGINTIPLYEGCAPGYKALLEFGGRPAIRYTLDALLAVEHVGRICVVGPCEELRQIIEADPLFAERCALVPGADTLLGSVRNGLAHFPETAGALVTTADMPLLTTSAIIDFLSGCAAAPKEYEHNLYLSAVPEESFTGAYRAADKMFSRYRDVSICQGNLGLVDPWIFHDPDTAARVDRVYAARKGRFSSALAFGWTVGLSYVFGVALFPLLKTGQLARIVSRRFGFGVVPVLCKHPEIAVDIDEPADYTFVAERLGCGVRPGQAATEIPHGPGLVSH